MLHATKRNGNVYLDELIYSKCMHINMQILGQTMYQTGYQKAPISALNLESSFCYKSNCNWLVSLENNEAKQVKNLI